MARDEMSPKIGDLDCSGLVNRWSFQPGVVAREGDNGGVMRDGTKIPDILAYKLRDSWTLNALDSAQLQTLHTLAEQDFVTAEIFDHRQNKRRTGNFLMELTDPPYGFTTPKGRRMFQAGGTLILEER